MECENNTPLSILTLTKTNVRSGFSPIRKYIIVKVICNYNWQVTVFSYLRKRLSFPSERNQNKAKHFSKNVV